MSSSPRVLLLNPIRFGKGESLTVFTPIRTQRVYMQIVDQILDLVRKGEFRPGSQLPPERDLAEQLKVSRASLREALSALQLLGLVETRSGQGTFVSGEATSTLLRLDASLVYQDLESPFTILQARKAVEPSIAALAARQRSDDALRQLKEIQDLAESDSLGLSSEGDRRFHLAIAEATLNPVLAHMMSIVYELMGQKLWLLLRDATASAPGRLRQYARQHRWICDAIESQDESAAAARMREHLDSVEKLMIEVELVPAAVVALNRTASAGPATPPRTRSAVAESAGRSSRAGWSTKVSPFVGRGTPEAASIE